MVSGPQARVKKKGRMGSKRSMFTSVHGKEEASQSQVRSLYRQDSFRWEAASTVAMASAAVDLSEDAGLLAKRVR